MKLAYTLWQDFHFKNIETILKETNDITDEYIITTLPLLQRDDIPLFIDPVITNPITKENIKKSTLLCKNIGKRVGLQIIPTPKDSRKKEPVWWQGYIYFTSELEWKTFFENLYNNIRQHVEIGEEVGIDYYLIGAEMSATLIRGKEWSALIDSIRKITNKPIGYSHHFCMPLKHYYNTALSLLVVFGYMFYGNNVYGKVLNRLLNNQFKIPSDQLNAVGKSLYHAPPFNPASLDIIKLNDYFWYVMDKEYSQAVLEKRWDKVSEGGVTVEFMPSVRSWLKKYTQGKQIMIENNLNMGYTNCSDSYYVKWLEIFIKKHKDLCDSIVGWDNSQNYKRWTNGIKELKSKGVV